MRRTPPPSPLAVAVALFTLTACRDKGSWSGPEHLSDCSSQSLALDDVVEVTGLAYNQDYKNLDVDVAFNSCLDAHVFVLCWPEQAFVRPANAQLELWHDNNTTFDCGYILTDTLFFDISQLGREWRWRRRFSETGLDDTASDDTASEDTAAEPDALTIELGGFSVEMPL